MAGSDIIQQWVYHFNHADADALAAMYSENATNYQVTQSPVIGRDNIRQMFRDEFATADMTCIIEAIHDAGNVVTLEWKDPNGLRGCGIFTLTDGMITYQRGYWDKLSFLKKHNLPIG